MELKKDGYTFSDDKSRLDLDLVLGWLRQTYWAAARTPEKMEKIAAGSMCFGLYDEKGRQVAFARAVTDRASFAWLADVVIAPDLRGKGLGKWLIACILDHPDLADLRLMLNTKDAHDFYRPFGFESDRCMKRFPEEWGDFGGDY